MLSKINLIAILIVSLFSNVCISQSLTWEYIPKNSSLGACTSSSDCNNGTFCYGLKYTPAVSGRITSYTLGFQGNCPGGGSPYLPVLSGSCVMTDNTDFINGCGTPTNMFLLQASGNSGNNITISQGQPIYLHRICFEVNVSDIINIEEDIITQLTVSVDSLINNNPITEVLSFSPFEIKYDDQTCNINFDVSNPWINVTSLPDGSIVNSESLVNSSPFDQSFDIWDEVAGNCQIPGGIDDILLTFSIINTRDINHNYVIDSLAGPMFRILQNSRGISGEIPFNINAQNESSSGDIRGYEVEVTFASHIGILADQISVHLDSINSMGKVFESAYLVFLDENLIPYSNITHHGFFGGETDLTGNCDNTSTSQVYTSSTPGVFFAKDVSVVSLADPCQPVNGVDGTYDNVSVNAMLHAGLNSMARIGGFKLVVFGEDVGAPDAIDTGVSMVPDDGVRANRKTNTAGIIRSTIKGFTVTGCVFNNSPLQVDWISLEANQKSHEVELIWTTAGELNIDFFDIEWSTDGIHFYKIGQEHSIGNGLKLNEYKFIHMHPVVGINYYKIRQTDIEGQYTYSSIVKVLVNNAPTLFDIFPNPTGNELNIILNGSLNNEKIILEWFNTKGQLIKSTILDQNISYPVDVTDLAAGPYILMLKSIQHLEVIKFIKL